MSTTNKGHRTRHVLIMLIGCGLPLLLIFLAPALGISNDISLLVFIVVMFACHLLHFNLHGGPHGHRHTPSTQDHEHT